MILRPQIPQGPRGLQAVLAGVAAVTGLGLAACGGTGASPLAAGSGRGNVVVGSANFPEDELLAEIYIQALREKGVHVIPKLNIGAREVYYPQVENGAITIMPEYNGALLTTSVDPQSRAATTAEVDAALRARLPASLEILNPSPAQDRDSLTVTQATARKYHLRSIADLRPYAGRMVIGGPPEFRTRSAGLPGLERVYGLRFRGFSPLDESGPVTLKALTSGKVQVADVFTTTPQIITDRLAVLADPRSVFAAQNVIPLACKKGVTPEIAATLNAISAKLDTASLLDMDRQIILDHASYSAVAANWLRRNGLR